MNCKMMFYSSFLRDEYKIYKDDIVPTLKFLKRNHDSLLVGHETHTKWTFQNNQDRVFLLIQFFMGVFENWFSCTVDIVIM